jgi:hypothetical protein
MKRWTRKQVNPHPLGHTIPDQAYEGLSLPEFLRAEWEAIPGGEITWADISYEIALQKCYSQRRAAYPPLSDQADADYKARQGDTSMQAQIDQAITNVKAQYPKPLQGSQSGVYGFLSKQAMKSPTIEAARKPLPAWATILLSSGASLLVSLAVKFLF